MNQLHDSTDSANFQPESAIRITAHPKPLPADYSARLARIYAIAAQCHQEYLAREGRETIAPEKREGGSDDR